jgi:hypothetical protein
MRRGMVEEGGFCLAMVVRKGDGFSLLSCHFLEAARVVGDVAETLRAFRVARACITCVRAEGREVGEVEERVDIA